MSYVQKIQISQINCKIKFILSGLVARTLYFFYRTQVSLGSDLWVLAYVRQSVQEVLQT